MDYLQALILGVVQGLSEFLPISSSGHLILVPYLFGWGEFDHKLIFDIALHLGTTLALLLFFWKDWWRLGSGFLRQLLKKEEGILKNSESRLFLILIIGSLPAAGMGVLFQDIIETEVRQAWVVGVMLIIFALVLKWAQKKEGKKDLKEISLKDGLVIGVWQALALIPGVSRSGSTISGGLFQGLDKVTATRFSFLLAAPAVFGAALLKLKDLIEVGTNGESGLFLVGIITSTITGLLVIKFLLAFVKRHNFDLFIWYRIGLGLVIIILQMN